WIFVFHSLNTSCPAGGRMSHPVCATTTPSRTRTRPTEQADAGLEFAVSKSMAVKSRGTNPPSPGHSSGRGRPAVAWEDEQPRGYDRSRRARDVVRVRGGRLRGGPARLSV